MITIYTSPSCASCRKVKKWFDEQKIPYVEKNIFTSVLNPEELKDMLAKSENGTDDIISKRSNVIKNGKYNIDSMSISQLIEFIKQNPTCLKRPIMVDDRKIQVGYNSEEIRSFIPRARRIADAECYRQQNCGECPDMIKDYPWEK